MCSGAGAYYDLNVALGDGSSYEIIGQKSAILFTELFDWSIPTFKVNAYGQVNAGSEAISGGSKG